MGQSFEDLFGADGKGANKTGTANYIKWDKVGDTFALVLRDAIVTDHPQVDFATKKPKWMTHTEGDNHPDGRDRWVAKAQGTFDMGDPDVEAFQLFELMLPVTVAAKAGDDSFEQFDAEWTFKGDQEAKFKDAVLEYGQSLEVGDIIQVKYLAEGKPRKYAVKIKAGEKK